jgi:hypothetical protein
MTIATFFFALLFSGQAVDIIENKTFLTAMHYGFITFALIAVAGIWFSFSRGSINR